MCCRSPVFTTTRHYGDWIAICRGVSELPIHLCSVFLGRAGFYHVYYITTSLRAHLSVYGNRGSENQLVKVEISNLKYSCIRIPVIRPGDVSAFLAKTFSLFLPEYSAFFYLIPKYICIETYIHRKKALKPSDVLS